jgi:hypothetical protein
MTAVRTGDRQRPLSEAQWQALYWMLMLPLAVAAGKWSVLPTSDLLGRHVSLLNVPSALRGTVESILFVPLGALVIVVFRLTLGIRLLGPFRSILLAFAFVVTGIWTGLLFTFATVAVMVLVRPVIKAFGVPYFGRVSVMLSAVVLVMIAGTSSGVVLRVTSLSEVVRFPVVVLCLIGEAVAITIEREGIGSGLWRTVTTALVAVAVAGLASIGGLRHLLLAFPELVLTEMALIIIVSRSFAWRVLERLNPAPATAAGPLSALSNDEYTAWRTSP